MKKPKRKQPEFGVDQVVARRGKHGKWTHYGAVYRVQLPTGEDPLLYCVNFDEDCLGNFDPWFRESELRPLTAKEKNCRHRHAK